jgi:hypothetical protein
VITLVTSTILPKFLMRCQLLLLWGRLRMRDPSSWQFELLQLLMC